MSSQADDEGRLSLAELRGCGGWTGTMAGTRAGFGSGSAARASVGSRAEAGFRSAVGTKVAAGDNSDAFVQDYIDALSSSDIQIYWPFSSEWDGESLPVITFDPEDDTSVNIGYRLNADKTGEIVVDTVLVDEKFAEEHPVWVVNRNNDEKYLTLEMLRNLGPGTVVGGGEVVVMPGSKAVSRSAASKSGADAPLKTFSEDSSDKATRIGSDEVMANSAGTSALKSGSDEDMANSAGTSAQKSGSDEVMANSAGTSALKSGSDEVMANSAGTSALKSGSDEVMANSAGTSALKSGSDEGASLKTLLIKDFTMKRHYDSWFAGASEFFVKCGAVENFTASTEAEMQLYSPSVTDFMIVVKRKWKGVSLPFNAILVSEWTDQLENCAFMIIEDDGGTTTSWECEALVRIASKSYGIQIDLPFKTRDDIVWRGTLSSRYLEQYNNITGHFGDVDITFEIISM